MKIAFSGCREISAYERVRSRIHPALTDYLKYLYMNTSAEDLYSHAVDVLVGDCPTGVDAAVRARYMGQSSVRSLTVYEAHWKDNGKAAGPIRNKAMIEEADALIAFWDGKSLGTKNCIKCATDKGIPVLIMPVGGERYD